LSEGLNIVNPLLSVTYSNATKDFEVFKSADPAPDHSSLEPESRRFFVASV
jgi:hypothetical protein